MTLRWDSLLVRHLAAELDRTCGGARLRALRLDGRTRDFVMLFRAKTLVWRLHPGRGYPLLEDEIVPDERDIRVKARVRRVYSPPDERMIVFECAPETNDGEPIEIFIELLGNQLNAIVSEGRERTVRHVLRRREGRRPVRTGIRYEPPPPTGREGAEVDFGEDGWTALVGSVPPDDRRAELMRRVAYVSPINVASFLDPTGEGDLARGYENWIALTSRPTAPTVLQTEAGPQPYPVSLPEMSAAPAPSLLDAFGTYALAAHGEAGRAAAALSVPPDLLESLERAIVHHERRVSRLRSELNEREEPLALRAIGDLILARYSEISPGASEVTLADFDGESVTVVLKAALTPSENAARYYDRATRSERAAERLPGLIERAEADRDQVVHLLAEAEAGSVDTRSVRKALPAGSGKTKGGDAPAGLPYKTFRSSGGCEIRVGRGARHNDDLTFRHSAPNDIWLHARHSAGAHVILRWPGPGNPSARDLKEAGTLAALHSKARTSSSVPVDWTLRKHVRKSRKSKPGSVVPERVKTLFVRPDPKMLDVLSDDR